MVTDDMIDQVELLERLAQKIWPTARVSAWPASDPRTVIVEDDDRNTRIAVYDHPLALQAVEAALREVID